MIDLDVWECRERHIDQRASLCLEREAIFGFVLRLMRGSFLMPVIWPTKHLYWVRAVMSGEWCWRTNCTLSPFSLRLMESQLERETCIFSSLRTAIFQNVQSLQYICKDVMVISVPYECPTWEIIVFISCTVWHHVYYDQGPLTRTHLKLTNLRWS